MFEVKCYECHKTTRVPFKPKPDRPVYCKACLKKLEEKKKEEKQDLKKLEEKKKEEKQDLKKEEEKKGFSLSELLDKKTVSFSKKEKKELDKEKLKQALRESLKEKIEPGDTIKF